jgi:hypothetical protein
MIAKIKRQECLEKYSKFPQIFNEDEFYYPKLIREYVLVLPIVSVDKYSSKLSQQFTLKSAFNIFEKMSGLNRWIY